MCEQLAAKDTLPLRSCVRAYSNLTQRDCAMRAVGDLTGYSPVNPARTLASSITFDCFGKCECWGRSTAAVCVQPQLAQAVCQLHEWIDPCKCLPL